MDNKFSGILGVLGLIGAVVLYFVLRKVFPSLATAMLVVGAVTVALIVILVVVVLFFALRKPKKKDGPAAENDGAAVLAKGRTNLTELRRMGIRIKNLKVRKLNEEICVIIDKILRALKDQPEDIPRVRQFLNYYLPTMGEILLKYVRVEESGIPAETVTQNTIAWLGDIKTAMEKQYANLFDDDILDLTVEMETLTLACKRDGLLTGEGTPLQDGGRSITLTL